MRNQEAIGIILVGGKSSRMGKNKALLKIGGSRLVDHVAAAIGKTGLNKIITSGEMLGYESVVDLVPNKGPVGGIVSSLIYCYNLYQKSYKTALLVPVDMPLISDELVSYLLNSSSTKNFVATSFQDKPLPFIIKLDELVVNLCKKVNEDLTLGKEVSVKNFLKRFDLATLPIPPFLVRSLTNTNTTEEWSLIQNEYQNQ